MRIILLGAPGVGKGTQAAFLSKKAGLPQISTGDIFRHNLKNETPLGKLAKGYMDKGLLVPDEVTINIVQDRLMREDCKYGFILDGFPRTLSQSESLDKVLNEMGSALDCAINFDVADRVIMNRLAGRRVCPNCGKTFHIVYEPPREQGVCDACRTPLTQREDDREETVIKRLHSYHEQTEPLIEHYQRRNLLVNVDAAKPIDAVSAEIEMIIDKIRLSNKEKHLIHKPFDLTAG